MADIRLLLNPAGVPQLWKTLQNLFIKLQETRGDKDPYTVLNRKYQLHTEGSAIIELLVFSDFSRLFTIVYHTSYQLNLFVSPSHLCGHGG